jgi:hypothetical protein
MLPRYRVHCWTLLLLLALLGTGCQREQPYGEVEGVITLDGKPLTKAEVVFLPDPEKGTKGRRSTALTDEQGRYRISSDKGRAGAPVGFHRVCINDLIGAGIGPAAPAIPEEGEEKGPAGPAGLKAPGPGGQNMPKSRLPKAYTNAAETPFRDIEVKEGTQIIDLSLKSSGSH